MLGVTREAQGAYRAGHPRRNVYICKTLMLKLNTYTPHCVDQCDILTVNITNKGNLTSWNIFHTDTVQMISR